MPEEITKLDAFIKVIMNDAKSESEAILSEVDANRGLALESAKKEYQDEADRYFQSELSRAKAESGRAVSKKLLENKRSLFHYRQKLGDELTEDVKNRIGEYTLTPEYGQRLEKLLQQALAQFHGSQVKVFLRPGDLILAQQFAKIPDYENVAFEEGDIELGGLICECPSQRLRADLTFDTRLAEISSRYSELFELEV